MSIKYWKISWYVYLVKCADDTLYCGITPYILERISDHNSGHGAIYTRPKSRRPVELVHMEGPFTHGDALRREAAIKKLSKKEKLELISGRK